MARPLTAGMEAASLAENIRPLFAVELDFSSGMVRANSTDRTLIIEGLSFLGIGRLGSIAPVRETTELSAYQMALILDGVRPNLIALAGTDVYQGRSCKVWFGAMDEDYAVIADPVRIFKGRIDTLKTDLGTEGRVTVTVENRLADWERGRVRRYTDADHQQEFPGDLFFEYVPKMQDVTLKWGRS